MNWLDIVIIVLVVTLGFLGWRLGIARLIVTIVSGIIGIHWAVRLYKPLANTFEPLTENEAFQSIIAFSLVLLLALIGGWLIVTLLKTLLKFMMLGWLDHSVGLVLGLGSGVLASATLVTGMNKIPIQIFERALTDSSMAPVLLEILGPVRQFLNLSINM
jgi:uncharacterized membrane protein required for colicin V production